MWNSHMDISRELTVLNPMFEVPSTSHFATWILTPLQNTRDPGCCKICNRNLMTTPFFSQVSFAGTIVASAVGTYIALSPPNPNSESTVSTDDLIHSLQLTSKHITKIAVFPVGLLALHTTSLAYFQTFHH